MEDSASQPLVAGIITRENWSQVVAYTADNVAYENSPLSSCDLLEFRGDTFEGSECLRCWSRFTESIGEVGAPSKTIFTLRLPRDGGQWKDDPKKRSAIWKGLEKITVPDFIDFEIESTTENNDLDLLRNIPSEIILSHHHLNGFPGRAKLDEVLDAMDVESPHGVKFAVACNSEQDCLELLQFAVDLKDRYELAGVMAVGKWGKASRILSPMLGIPLVYGYIGRAPTIEGQWEASKLRKALQTERSTPLRSLSSLTVETIAAYAVQYQ